MNRRVVVTGVGLVCGCGIGTEEVWRNLLAGKSGIGPRHAIRCERLRLPHCRRSEGLRSAELDREKRAEEDGAVHSAGHGRVGFCHAHGRARNHAGNRGRDGRLHRIGHRRIRRNRARTLQIPERRPRQDFPIFHSFRDREPGLWKCFHPLWSQGAQFGHGDGMLRRSSRGGRRVQDHPALRCRSDDCGRLGSGGDADEHRRIRGHARAFDTQRRARARQPAF